MKSKTKIILGIIAVTVVIAISVPVIYHIYQSNLPSVSQQIRLQEYTPFKVGTRAAYLNEESTLKLTSDLPRLDGATALYPVYASFVQAVYPEGDYEIDHYYSKDDFLVNCTTTGHAYTNLINGETDIIFVAGISEQHAKMAEEMGIELQFTPIGREAFVFFVNSDNPVNSLTTEQLQGIYSGEITNWREVGGKNRKIIAYQREENSGSQTMLINFMGNTPLMNPRTGTTIGPMGGMIYVVEYKNNNNAIGYSFLFYSTEMVQSDQIKLLELDGIAPTRENIVNETYPQTGYFYAVSVIGNDNPNIDIFIEWILSPEGQELIEKSGYTPLN